MTDRTRYAAVRELRRLVEAGFLRKIYPACAVDFEEDRTG